MRAHARGDGRARAAGWCSPTSSTSTCSTATAATSPGYYRALRGVRRLPAASCRRRSGRRPRDHHRRSRQRSDLPRHRPHARVRAAAGVRSAQRPARPRRARRPSTTSRRPSPTAWACAARARASFLAALVGSGGAPDGRRRRRPDAAADRAQARRRRRSTTTRSARSSRGVTDGSIPDYQAAAMLMAIFFRGLDDARAGALDRRDARTRAT